MMATGAKNKKQTADHFSETLAIARRIRQFVRLSGGGICLAAALYGGRFWLLGSFCGCLLTEINLDLLIHFIKKAHQWQGRSLAGTLIKFYLTFAATALLCFLVIRNGWGHPVAFLAGLLSFIAALGLTALSLALKKIKKNGHGQS